LGKFDGLMSVRPKVSVLIPCYNAEAYIGETLESVFRQSWPEIEIVVVDDGSTDQSRKTISSFKRSNLRLIHQTNRGQTAALNQCLQHVTGAYIQYLDADDLIAANKIELQMDRLRHQPNCVASAPWGRFQDNPEEAWFDFAAEWQDLDSLDWLATSRANGLGMMFPALWLIPTGVARAAGPWREELTLNNDAEYFTRVILSVQRVLFCEGARCYYRSGIPGSLSGRKSAKAWASQFRVIDLCESYVLAYENSERMRRGFALSWQHLAHACYPYDRQLAERALERAKALHEVEIHPTGGTGFHIASRLLGWRTARRLQVASGRP
jgi:glycosyltransferase involved in cell wall biosynthesis